MTNLKVALIFLLLILTNSSSYSAETIKFGILDNFKYQKYVTTKYKDYYLQGLTTAIKEANKSGIIIEYKIFQYDQNPLSIISKISELLAWNPDVIIGPRDSNKFLILSNYIKAILTVSPFATSLNIQKMQNNFYSITLSDAYEANAIYDFIQWKFHDKELAVLTEAECKSCADVSEEVVRLWSKNKHNLPTQKYFISEQVNTLSLNDIIKKNDNKIFLIANNAHSSAILMARISSISQNKSIFIGGDGWGSWEDTEAGKLGDVEKYTAYHILPWGLEIYSKDMSEFQDKFFKIYKTSPHNKLSFIVYQTVMSIVTSYQKYGKNVQGTTQSKLLFSYKTALSNNKYWYKPTNYLVYKINNKKNSPFVYVNPLTKKIMKYKIAAK